MKIILDPESKIELLIKLAFGISIEDLSKEYKMSANKIINLRKNNYVKYNEFVEYWRIDKEVASLGLTPKYERALSVVKKFYGNKVKILSEDSIYFNGKYCTLSNILDIADKILEKDNIIGFSKMTSLIKNNY